MQHDQLIDLTRRALKLARDRTTDLAPTAHVVDARDYTCVQRHQQDRAMLLASPQLVGYVSGCPPRDVLHQDGDGPIRPVDPNLRRLGEGVQQRLPAPPVAGGDRMRHRQPVQLPLPRVDLRQHRPAGRTAGPRGIPGRDAALCRPDRAAGHRVRRIPLGVTGSGSDAGRGHPPRAARRRTRLLGYRPLVPARREGARLRDQLETRDRHVRRELPFRHRAPADLRHDRAQQLHGVRLLRAAS